VSYTRGPGVQHWHSIDTMNDGLVAPQTIFGSAAWPTADLAIYSPVIVRSRSVVKQLWYFNGVTATGNYDIGLYDAGGTALLRKGSTAKTTTSTEIVWDCTDTTIGPGIYYLALVCSNATDTFSVANPSAPALTAFGILTEAAALPLPATATFALTHSLAAAPLVGMFLDTRVT
jgi:hypothetical protein